MEKIVVMTIDELEALEGRIAQKVVDRIKPLLAPEPNRIMNIKSVAAYLDVPESYVYHLTSSKAIPHRKRRGKLSFDKKEIDQWREGFTIPATDNTFPKRVAGGRQNGKN